MELLSLLPLILKILPFAAIGVLYALWRRASGARDKAKAEAEAAKDSYELAEEVREIEKEGEEDVKEVENLDLDGVVDALRGIMRDRPKS
jgi:hypothetical protein